MFPIRINEKGRRGEERLMLNFCWERAGREKKDWERERKDGKERNRKMGGKRKGNRKRGKKERERWEGKKEREKKRGKEKRKGGWVSGWWWGGEVISRQ